MPNTVVWYPGTSNFNGQWVGSLTLLSTETKSLVNGTGVISSANGSGGIFTCSGSNTQQAIWADVVYNVGNPGNGTALSAGANVAGWFLTSIDGSTFETPTGATAPPRSPDFIIPLPAATTSSGAIFKSIGVHAVKVPASNFKVYFQNNTGQSISPGTTTSPSVTLSLVAVQYPFG